MPVLHGTDRQEVDTTLGRWGSTGNRPAEWELSVLTLLLAPSALSRAATPLCRLVRTAAPAASASMEAPFMPGAVPKPSSLQSFRMPHCQGRPRVKLST